MQVDHHLKQLWQEFRIIFGQLTLVAYYCSVLALVVLTACTPAPSEDEGSESPPDENSDTEAPAVGSSGLVVEFDTIWQKLKLTIPAASDNETAAEKLVYEVRVAGASGASINTLEDVWKTGACSSPFKWLLTIRPKRF